MKTIHILEGRSNRLYSLIISEFTKDNSPISDLFHRDPYFHSFVKMLATLNEEETDDTEAVLDYIVQLCKTNKELVNKLCEGI